MADNSILPTKDEFLASGELAATSVTEEVEGANSEIPAGEEQADEAPIVISPAPQTPTPGGQVGTDSFNQLFWLFNFPVLRSEMVTEADKLEQVEHSIPKDPPVCRTPPPSAPEPNVDEIFAKIERERFEKRKVIRHPGRIFLQGFPQWKWTNWY